MTPISDLRLVYPAAISRTDMSFEVKQVLTDCTILAKTRLCEQCVVKEHNSNKVHMRMNQGLLWDADWRFDPDAVQRRRFGL